MDSSFNNSPIANSSNSITSKLMCEISIEKNMTESKKGLFTLLKIESFTFCEVVCEEKIGMRDGKPWTSTQDTQGTQDVKRGSAIKPKASGQFANRFALSSNYL